MTNKDRGAIIKNKYSVLISDLDGTVYPIENPITDALRYNVIDLIAKIHNIPFCKAAELYWKLPGKYPNPYHGLYILGVTPHMYTSIFNQIDVERYIVPNTQLCSFFRELDVTTNIVTLAPTQYAWRVLQALGIRQFIDGVYSVNSQTSYKKDTIYYNLANQYTMESMLVAGDSYYNDIVPAQKLGIKSVLIAPQSTPACSTVSSIYALSKML